MKTESLFPNYNSAPEVLKGGIENQPIRGETPITLNQWDAFIQLSQNEIPQNHLTAKDLRVVKKLLDRYSRQSIFDSPYLAKVEKKEQVAEAFFKSKMEENRQLCLAGLN